ncbi:MAG: hypothetical protein QGG09_19065 [Pirellulaceae bacterium]|jgi:hypothetical protein|nr:hypothetical protein [Pirellulaceae bacterium]HJN13794.1 hypothetical protein [Pirellulaceae bacterium]
MRAKTHLAPSTFSIMISEAKTEPAMEFSGQPVANDAPVVDELDRSSKVVVVNT